MMSGNSQVQGHCVKSELKTGSFLAKPEINVSACLFCASQYFMGVSAWKILSEPRSGLTCTCNWKGISSHFLICWAIRQVQSCPCLKGGFTSQVQVSSCLGGFWDWHHSLRLTYLSHIWYLSRQPSGSWGGGRGGFPKVMVKYNSDKQNIATVSAINLY